MNVFEHEVAKLKTVLAQAMPTRLVSGSLTDHAELRRTELLQGVITVMVERIKSDGDWNSTIQLLITGQVEIEMPADKDSAGAVVENAELELYAQLRAALRNLGNLPAVSVKDVEFSAHSKVPFGWFLLRAHYGPINEACTAWNTSSLPAAPPNLYPPTLQVTSLDATDIKVDIEPHASHQVHKDWLDGKPTIEQPDLVFQVKTE